MHKFDKMLYWNILCCSPDAYLNVVMSDHFHFVYFRDRANSVTCIWISWGPCH